VSCEPYWIPKRLMLGARGVTRAGTSGRKTFIGRHALVRDFEQRVSIVTIDRASADAKAGPDNQGVTVHFNWSGDCRCNDICDPSCFTTVTDAR
jgi:hypothetical protein